MSEPKAPPHDAESEAMVLGAILVDNEALGSAVAVLDRDDFFREPHKHLWDAMLDLAERGESIDVVTLRATLEGSGLLERVGGVAYMSSLMDGLPRNPDVTPWAKLIRSRAMLRQIARVSAQLNRAAYEADAVPEEVLAAGIGVLSELVGVVGGDVWRDNRADTDAAIADAEARLKDPEGIIGLRTGLLDLDRRLQGMLPGQLGLIGGRPGDGKSTLLMQMAEAATSQKLGRAVVYSLEMSGPQLAGRRLSGEARVNLRTLYGVPQHKQAERWDRINAAFGKVIGPEMQTSTSLRTVSEFALHAREVQRKHGLAAVFVDYLQIVDPKRTRAHRNEEVAELARDLKQMARDLGVPVIAAAQLNRAPDNRKDKRPVLGDFAESSSLEKEADWAVLIHREPPPQRSEAPGSTRGLADLHVAKHRDGAPGVMRVRFNKSIGRFESLAHEHQEQAWPA